MTVDDVTMKIMDVETVEAIDRLGDRIDAVETTLGDRIDAVETTLGNRIDAVETTLGNRIDAVEIALGNRIDGVETTLTNRTTRLAQKSRTSEQSLAAVRTELRQGLEENRRYTLMLNESTRHDIQMVAEGVASLAVRSSPWCLSGSESTYARCSAERPAQACCTEIDHVWSGPDRRHGDRRTTRGTTLTSSCDRRAISWLGALSATPSGSALDPHRCPRSARLRSQHPCRGLVPSRPPARQPVSRD